MICLGSESRHLKQRPFSGLVINVNKNTGAGYSPIISIHCVNVAISKTSINFKSVFFIRCRRSDSSIFVDKWNLTAATIARSFSQRAQAAIRQLRTWPRIHVQPRFQWGFRNGVTFLRVVYGCTHLILTITSILSCMTDTYISSMHHGILNQNYWSYMISRSVFISRKWLSTGCWLAVKLGTPILTGIILWKSPMSNSNVSSDWLTCRWGQAMDG